MKNSDWQSIEILVPAPAVDLVCAELASLDCAGTLVEKRDLDSFIVPTDEIAPDTDLSMQAYFDLEKDEAELRAGITEILQEMKTLFPDRSFALGERKLVRQKDWAEDWKQHFSTMLIGQRLIIRPSWKDYRPEKNEVVLELDPGMAFGTGTHGTTLLCLKAIVELFDQGQAPDSLLDVGTGSGILAMAAAALGTQTVLACDIDPLACEVAQENCRRNGLAKQIRITSDPLDQLSGDYDLVVANILAEENLRLADQLVTRLSDGGHLFLSGILKEKEDLVRQGFSRQPLKLLQVTYEDEWVCLIWQKL